MYEAMCNVYISEFKILIHNNMTLNKVKYRQIQLFKINFLKILNQHFKVKCITNIQWDVDY